MKNKTVRFLALLMSGTLALTGLAGCGHSSLSSTAESGLMGNVKEDAAASTADTDDSGSDSEEDDPSDDMIGKYVSQGYENPSFGFVISLPDSYSLTSRATFTGVDEDEIEASNSESTYDSIRSAIALGTTCVFEAADDNSDTFIYLNIEKSSAGEWDDEKKIAENSVFDEDDIKEYFDDDTGITDFQNNVEEIQFLGEKHCVGQYTFKQNGTPFYGVTIFFISEDKQYLLSININGSDLDAVDQADEFFSIYSGSNLTEQSASSNTEEAEEPSVGIISGSVYRNDYFGLQCSLEDPWSYQTEDDMEASDNYASSDEELKSILEAGNTAIDMGAVYDTEEKYQSLNVNITKGDEQISGNTDAAVDELLQEESFGESLLSQLEEMGYENVNMTIESHEFMGKERKEVKITGEASGVKCYWSQVYLLKGSYVMVVTAFSAVDDSCQEILSAFSSL